MRRLRLRSIKESSEDEQGNVRRGKGEKEKEKSGKRSGRESQEDRGKSGRRSRRKRVMMDRESRWLSSGRGGLGQREDEKGVGSEKSEQKQRSFPPLAHDEPVSYS